MALFVFRQSIRLPRYPGELIDIKNIFQHFCGDYRDISLLILVEGTSCRSKFRNDFKAFTYLEQGRLWTLFRAFLLERRRLSKALDYRFTEIEALDSANRSNYVLANSAVDWCNRL